MNTEELKKIAARKVYKILFDEKIKISFPTILANTVKTMNDKFVVNISLSEKKIKEKKNFFYNFFNCRVRYDTKTVSFVYEISDLDNSVGADDKKIQDIIDKINKLLNVTEERGATEAEAITASLMAQKLMKKYSIEYANIKNDENEKICELRADTPSGYKWKYSFAQSVATSYCCHVCRAGDTLIFRGYKADILIARRVYMYLYDTCVRLAKQEKKRGNDFTSFCLGFTRGVADRLSSNCKALALTTPYKVEKDWEEYVKNLGRGKAYSFKNVDEDSFEKGKVEGKKAVDGQYITAHNEQYQKNETLLIGAS